jgi:hypothetical protein
MIFQDLVNTALTRARTKHPEPIHSRHEGIAVIEEEFMEARDAVFTDKQRSHLLVELVHTAAMCRRMAEDLNLKE